MDYVIGPPHPVLLKGAPPQVAEIRMFGVTSDGASTEPQLGAASLSSLPRWAFPRTGSPPVCRVVPCACSSAANLVPPQTRRAVDSPTRSPHHPPGCAGNSICCHVHGFAPYFYCAIPPGFGPDDLDNFRKALNARCVSPEPSPCSRTRLFFSSPLCCRTKLHTDVASAACSSSCSALSAAPASRLALSRCRCLTPPLSPFHPHAMQQQQQDRVAEQTSARQKQPLYVVSVEAVRKQTLWGYQREKERPFLKVVMVLPTMVTTARTVLERARRGSPFLFSFPPLLLSRAP